jgi:predicted transposase YdaD
VVASDKLFYWLFQHQPDRILPLLPDLPADASGYRFSAPVLKEREYRLDGLFLPPPERPELPALILEAQMAADAGFLRRLYAETARLLQQEPAIERWRVVVLCPSRELHFGDPAPLAEFVVQRVQWIELLPAAANPTAPALVQALALLLQSEQELPATSSALRARVAGSSQAAEIDDVIAAILVSRFNGRSIQELCAMGGITLDDFTQSVAYREIFGRGEAQGEARGVALGEARGVALGEARGIVLGQVQGEAKVTLRLLSRRCGPLSAEQESVIRSMPLERLEALAEALLDFEGMADLHAWMAANS